MVYFICSFSDLATETKYFYEKKDVTTQGYTAAPFGGVNENLDGAFATQESACFFESPKNMLYSYNLYEMFYFFIFFILFFYH